MCTMQEWVYLFRYMFARYCRYASHEVRRDKRSYDCGVETGRFVGHCIAVEMQRDENNRHLADLANIPW